MTIKDIDFERLVRKTPYTSDLAFNLNGVTADKYIAKVIDEINNIDLTSIPIDKWDMVVTFSLALLDVAGDFYVGDPSFESSLANKNGKFCEWLKQFHDPNKDTPGWIKNVAKFLQHDDQSIDCQIFSGSKGEHRGKSLMHDLPLTYFLYRKKPEKEGELTTAEKAYNATLVLHDVVIFAMAVWSLSTGKYVDFEFGKDGSVVLIQDSGYKEYSPIVAVVKYALHMMADFCSSSSLPLPGWSILSHFPDRDIEAFAMKLYRNGMNTRTLALQSIPVAVVELLMSLYVWIRSRNSTEQYSEEAWDRKKEKLLLIAHGITSAVNIGKVIIAEAPWRLNLVVIVRTFQLMWNVLDEESKLTNRHIEKLDAGILRARIESSKTLVLLDELLLEADDLNQIVGGLAERVKSTGVVSEVAIDTLAAEVSKLDNIMED